MIPSFISAIVAHVTFGLCESLLFPELTITSLFAVPHEANLRFTVAEAPQLLGYLVVIAVVVLFARMLIAALGYSERQFRLKRYHSGWSPVSVP